MIDYSAPGAAASQDTHRITGQIVNVDGGHCLRRGLDWFPLVQPRFGGRDVLLGRDAPPASR